MEALALALETKLEPLAAHQLAGLVATIRSSDADRKPFVGVPVGVLEEEAVRKVADKCWWFVMAARGQGGFVWGADIRDSVLTPGLQMEYLTDSLVTHVDHSAEAWRDSEAWRAAKGGKAGGRRPASKGRGVQPTRTHTRTHARTHARTRTHGRTHVRTMQACRQFFISS
jgi:hypothetical protein